MVWVWPCENVHKARIVKNPMSKKLIIIKLTLKINTLFVLRSGSLVFSCLYVRGGVRHISVVVYVLCYESWQN